LYEIARRRDENNEENRIKPPVPRNLPSMAGKKRER